MFYLNCLIVRRDNNLIKAITGPRRAGKSFLLDPIFKDYLLGQGVPEDHIISISFDIEDDDTPQELRQKMRGLIEEGLKRYGPFPGPLQLEGE